jgi:flavodoxin
MTAPVYLVYFSPTGTTRMIVNRIAAEFTTAAVESHDLTLSPKAPDLLITDGVTIIAV